MPLMAPVVRELRSLLRDFHVSIRTHANRRRYSLRPVYIIIESLPVGYSRKLAPSRGVETPYFSEELAARLNDILGTTWINTGHNRVMFQYSAVREALEKRRTPKTTEVSQ